MNLYFDHSIGIMDSIQQVIQSGSNVSYILYIKVVYKETNKIEAELKNKNIIKE